MKLLPALTLTLILSAAPAALAQEFKLPPERGAADDALNYSCQELDREIAKARKYIEIVQSESNIASESSTIDPGMALAENGLPRGEAAGRANERLNHLEAIRKDKLCPAAK
jgi:hypothetical protein